MVKNKKNSDAELTSEVNSVTDENGATIVTVIKKNDYTLYILIVVSLILLAIISYAAVFFIRKLIGKPEEQKAYRLKRGDSSKDLSKDDPSPPEMELQFDAKKDFEDFKNHAINKDEPSSATKFKMDMSENSLVDLVPCSTSDMVKLPAKKNNKKGAIDFAPTRDEPSPFKK